MITDFAELKPEYYSLGVQLKVPVYVIEVIKSDTGDRLVKIFDHWLHNTQEDLWFEQLYTALQRMHRSDLATIVRENYMKKASEGSYRPIVATSSPSIKPRDNISFSKKGKVSDRNAPIVIYSRFISHCNLYYLCNNMLKRGCTCS